MVCEKCQSKLGKVITPDPWKDGARNTTESGGRKVNENKALTAKKPDLYLTPRLKSAEYVSKRYTNLVPTTVKHVRIAKVSAQCVGRG